MQLMRKHFDQIKNIEMAQEAWMKLEESFEGTEAMKCAKAYIVKQKFASFNMKKDESAGHVPIDGSACQ